MYFYSLAYKLHFWYKLIFNFLLNALSSFLSNEWIDNSFIFLLLRRYLHLTHRSNLNIWHWPQEAFLFRMDIKRGREKTVASPDGEARKKKGSLFRRASLSRKKNKEEAKMRSKSKDRYAEHSQSTNTLSTTSNDREKTRLILNFRWRAWFLGKEKSQIFIPSTWPQITFRSA